MKTMIKKLIAHYENEAKIALKEANDARQAEDYNGREIWKEIEGCWHQIIKDLKSLLK